MRTRPEALTDQVHQFRRRTGREALRRGAGRLAVGVGRTAAALAVLLVPALAAAAPGAAAQGPLPDSGSVARFRAPDPGFHRQPVVFLVTGTAPSDSVTQRPSLAPGIGQLLGGVGGGIVGAFIAPAAVLLVYGDELGGGAWEEGLLPFMLALATGYCVGSASGVYAVSRAQGRDGSFGAALGGSALALIPAVVLTPATAGLSFVVGIPAASAYGFNRSAARRAPPPVPPAPAPEPTPTPLV
jgi:hypothetical protein